MAQKEWQPALLTLPPEASGPGESRELRCLPGQIPPWFHLRGFPAVILSKQAAVLLSV